VSCKTIEGIHESRSLLTFTDDSYKSIIWAMAECSMTIVATSIPVLRVVFKQVVNSAIEGYNSSGPSKASKASKSSTNPSNAGSSRNRDLRRQSNKRMTDISISGESVKDVFGRGSQNYVELDDLADKEPGRITASTPDSLRNASEHHAPDWPV
jgi:hypothetical protein